MQKLVLTKRFPAYLVAFQITPKTVHFMWTGPMLNTRYVKASKQFREKNQYVHCASVRKKNTFSPNLNTGNNRILCHFLQASLQLLCQCLEVCVYVHECLCTWSCPVLCMCMRCTCVLGSVDACMPAFACRPLCVCLCVCRNERLSWADGCQRQKQAQHPPPPFPHGTGLPGMNGGHGSRFRSSRRVLDGRGCLLQ